MSTSSKNPRDVLSITAETENLFPEPFKTRLGQSEWRGLGDIFGLTQFAVNHEVIMPGAQSALKHWHTASDEFVFVLSGELQLVTDEVTETMSAGMCMGFRAGDSCGHHLVNASDLPATFIVIGTRVENDEVHYPDDDLMWQLIDGQWVPLHKDGSPY